LADFVLREQLTPGATVVVNPARRRGGRGAADDRQAEEAEDPVGVGAAEELAADEGSPDADDIPADES